MNHVKISIALLVVLLGLGGLATYDEWMTKKEEKEKETKDKIFQIDRPAVSEIVYESKLTTEVSGSKENPTPIVRLIRKDAKWFVSEPVEALADETVITNLLQTIDDFKMESKVVSDKSKWGEYGLDKPQRMITLKMPGKTPEELKIFVGEKSQIGYSMYIASTTSDDVYLGSQYFLTATNKTLKDFRDKTFFTNKADEIASFVLKRPNAPVLKISELNSEWTMEEPFAAKADRDSVESFVRDIANLKAEDFKDNPSKDLVSKFNQSKVKFELEITKKDNAKLKLQIAEIDKVYWLSYDPSKLWYQIAEASKQKFDKLADDFRLKKIFNFSSEKLLTLNIDGETYSKKDNGWYLDSDPKEAKAFLSSAGVDLEYLKTDSFIDINSKQAKEVFSSAPKHKIILGFKDQTPPNIQIEVWEDSKDKAKCFIKASETMLPNTLFRSNCSIFNSMKAPTNTAQSPAETGAPDKASGS